MKDERKVFSVTLKIESENVKTAEDLEILLKQLNINGYTNDCVSDKKVVGFWDNVVDSDMERPMKNMNEYQFEEN